MSRINKVISFLVVLFAAIIFSSQALFAQNSKKNMDNPFGVLEFLHWDHPWNKHKYGSAQDLEKVVKSMVEAHVGWVRMDFLWDDIESTEGKFNFSKYDSIVNLLTKNNINILGILDYSAGWASGNGLWNSPPKDNKLFVTFALRVISRYKDKIKYWEVWNEPDSFTYWAVQDGLKSYCALLKEVYFAAKKIDPECKILNGGLANGLASVNHLYDNGCKDCFDILNIHVFETPLNSNPIKSVTVYPKLAYKVMSRNGDADKKIWITEIGCPGVKRGLKVKNWWMGKNPNEEEQAGWLKTVYGELLKDKNTEKVFWAFFRDTKNHWDNGVDYFGIMRWDFSKKPGFKAYKKSFEAWKKTQRKIK